MPASFVGRSAIELWRFPFDDAAGDFEARLLWLYTTGQQDHLPLDQSWYGLTAPVAYSGIRDCAGRGVDQLIVVDHTEAAAPTQHKLLVQLKIDEPAMFADATRQLWIGTSPRGGALNHEKGAVFNSPRDGRVIPPQDFDSLEAAAAAGYPITLLGSWNPSPAGSLQTNFVVIMPGTQIAQQVSAGIVATAAFMKTHDPQDQM